MSSAAPLSPLEQMFPLLASTPHNITSPRDIRYNCIAWAAGQQDRFWWPQSPLGTSYYWPPGVPRDLTIDSFIKCFETLGYHECSDSTLEDGFEKVAIYALGLIPTHAARQQKNGEWTSKLGPYVDIEHKLGGLVGTSYGRPVKYMKRKRQETSSAKKSKKPKKKRRK